LFWLKHEFCSFSAARHVTTPSNSDIFSMALRFLSTFKMNGAEDMLIYVNLLPKNRLLAFDRKNRAELMNVNASLSGGEAESLGRFSIYNNHWFDSASYYKDRSGDEMLVAAYEGNKWYHEGPHLRAWLLPGSSSNSKEEFYGQRIHVARSFQCIGYNESLYLQDAQSGHMDRIEFLWRDVHDASRWDKDKDKEVFFRSPVPTAERAAVETAFLDHSNMLTGASWDQMQSRQKVLIPSMFDSSSIPTGSSVPSPHTSQAVVQNMYSFSCADGVVLNETKLLALGHDWGRVTLWRQEHTVGQTMIAKQGEHVGNACGPEDTCPNAK